MKTTKQETISCEQIERMMQIAQDIKKRFAYDKSSGLWFWCDRDEENDPMAEPFSTFLDALKDAVEPYLHPEE